MVQRPPQLGRQRRQAAFRQARQQQRPVEHLRLTENLHRLLVERRPQALGQGRGLGEGVVAPCEADEDVGGGGDRQQAMVGLDQAAVERKRCHAPVRTCQRSRDAAGRDDVHQRIAVVDLVELHLLDGHRVHARLGHGENGQDRDRCLRRSLTQVHHTDQPPHSGAGAGTV